MKQIHFTSWILPFISSTYEIEGYLEPLISFISDF